MAQNEVLGCLIMSHLKARRERGCSISLCPAVMSAVSTLGVAVPLMNLSSLLHLSLM